MRGARSCSFILFLFFCRSRFCFQILGKRGRGASLTIAHRHRDAPIHPWGRDAIARTNRTAPTRPSRGASAALAERAKASASRAGVVVVSAFLFFFAAKNLVVFYERSWTMPKSWCASPLLFLKTENRRRWPQTTERRENNNRHTTPCQTLDVRDRRG